MSCVLQGEQGYAIFSIYESFNVMQQIKFDISSCLPAVIKCSVYAVLTV